MSKGSSTRLNITCSLGRLCVLAQNNMRKELRVNYHCEYTCNLVSERCLAAEVWSAADRAVAIVPCSGHMVLTISTDYLGINSHSRDRFTARSGQNVHISRDHDIVYSATILLEAHARDSYGSRCFRLDQCFSHLGPTQSTWMCGIGRATSQYGVHRPQFSPKSNDVIDHQVSDLTPCLKHSALRSS